MELIESVKIIERMMQEGKKSLHNYSAYFIVWGLVMAPAGIVEYFMIDSPYSWVVWPIATFIGGIISAILGYLQGKKEQVFTAMDRVVAYTWGAFGFCLIFAIFYSLYLGKTPHTLVLMLAGGATFVSGGISKFKPFIWGGIALEVAAIACGFLVEAEFHGVVFAGGILLGYIIPGFLLRNIENEPTQ
ncbi:MAG: hypothetical protein WDZ35_10560 [Crocinitomicaceae bacterium]